MIVTEGKFFDALDDLKKLHGEWSKVTCSESKKIKELEARSESALNILQRYRQQQFERVTGKGWCAPRKQRRKAARLPLEPLKWSI